MFKRTGLITSLAALLLAGASCDNSKVQEIKPTDSVVTERKDQEEPDCRLAITSQELEGILGMGQLYTDDARANVVSAYLDRLGFSGWVSATGGPSFDCLGDGVPISDNRINWTINFYKGKKRFFKAGEVAQDAGYAKQDGKFFRLSREIYLEGARDISLSNDDRVRLYEEAIKYGNRSFEENAALAKEAIPFFISSGYSWKGNGFLEKALPDKVDYIDDNETKSVKELPPELKAKKEGWLKDLEKAEDWKVRKCNDCGYDEPTPERECGRLFLYGSKGWSDVFEMELNDVREGREQCSTENLLRAYEAARWFDHARQLAVRKGMADKVALYGTLSDRLQITDVASKNWRGDLL